MDDSLIKNNMPNLVYNLSAEIEAAQEEMFREKEEKRLREIEDNKSLKRLVDYNKGILNYNRELVSLNEKILRKVNSLNDTLLFLNDAFIDKSKVDKENGQSHNALLVELIEIIDSKDEGKLNKFINGIAAPVGAGLIVEYFKLKLGLV